MIHLSLGAAILLLSSVAPAEPAANSQPAIIEGCLSGNVDAFVLTAKNGKSYPLSGSTNQLTGRIGHEVRLWGQAVSGDPELIPAGVPQATFEVEKVRSLSASCR